MTVSKSRCPLAYTTSLIVLKSRQDKRLICSSNPAFYLIDVCKVLGLTTNGITRRLQDDVISNHPIIDRFDRTQQALFFNEDGLYDVILDSRKPETRQFQKRVTGKAPPLFAKMVAT
nr:MAG TPA: antirepressor [Caudoviricetes sp.]